MRKLTFRENRKSSSLESSFQRFDRGSRVQNYVLGIAKAPLQHQQKSGHFQRQIKVIPISTIWEVDKVWLGLLRSTSKLLRSSLCHAKRLFALVLHHLSYFIVNTFFQFIFTSLMKTSISSGLSFISSHMFLAAFCISVVLLKTNAFACPKASRKSSKLLPAMLWRVQFLDNLFHQWFYRVEQNWISYCTFYVLERKDW